MKNGSKREKSLICTKSEISEGHSIEEEVRIATVSNGSLEGNAPLIFTERKEGVLPQYDPRTDRWAIAQEAMSKVAATVIARREAGVTAESLYKEGFTKETYGEEFKKRLKAKNDELKAQNSKKE